MPSRARRVHDASGYDDSIIRLAGLSLIAAWFSLIPLFFDPAALNAFSVPKALVGQLLGILLLGVLASLFVRFGWTIWRPSPIHAAAGALFLVYVLAAAFAVDKRLALIGSPENAVGLIALADQSVLFVALSVIVRRRWEAVLVGAALLLPVVPVFLYEVIQRSGRDPLTWSMPEVNRPFSTFGNPDLLAPYLGTIAVAAMVIAALGQKIVGRTYRIGLAVIGLIGIAGTLMTGTRSALVGFIAVLVLMPLLMVLRGTTARERRWALMGGAVVMFLGGAVVAITPTGERFAGLARSVTQTQEGLGQEGSVAARLALYEAALAQLGSRPLLGVGPDNFTAAFPSTRPEDGFTALGQNAVEASTHDWILKVATDAGVFGLLALAAALVTAVGLVLRQRSDVTIPLASVGAATFLLATGLFVPNDAGTDWLLWAALGIIAGSIPGRGSGHLPARRPARRPSRVRTFVSYLLLLIAGVAALQVLPGFEAGRAAQLNRSLRLTGSLPASIAAGERATALVPYRAEYWHGLGLSFARSQEFSSAERSFAKAVELAPYHTTYVDNLARAQLGLGLAGNRSKVSDAVANAMNAVRGDRNNGDAYVTLAVVLAAAGRPEDAVVASERASVLGSSTAAGDYYLLVGRAYLRLHRGEEAERMLRIGLSLQPDPQTWASIEVELARTLSALGRTGDALEELRKVLAALPGHPAAQQLLRELSAP